MSDSSSESDNSINDPDFIFNGIKEDSILAFDSEYETDEIEHCPTSLGPNIIEQLSSESNDEVPQKGKERLTKINNWKRNI